MFKLEHQDGNILYRFEKGGFSVVDEKLYISIESVADDEKAFPDRYLFAVDGLPLVGGLIDSNVKLATNPNDESPNVHVYTTFHACDVEAKITLSVVSDYEIEIEINVISDDVNYYDETAQPNPFLGKVKLKNKKLSELWMPM